jgi:pimeloyl-ACP methyl ester carboxylesterase
MRTNRPAHAFGLAVLTTLGCASDPAAPPSARLQAEVGFVDIAPRTISLRGQTHTLSARAHLFYNLHPAVNASDAAPIFIAFNGFSSTIVRAFGTGPQTVAQGGAVVPNPASLTNVGHVLYIDPRQSGFSYDTVDGRAPTRSDCGAAIFNEYVDAADVLLGALQILAKHRELTGPAYWVGESYGGVRIQWILAYLRAQWGLYQDEALRDALQRVNRKHSLRAGQILLQPWLAGKAHAEAIADACAAPELVQAVVAKSGVPCASANACACATGAGLSRYNLDFTTTQQDKRELEAANAHVDPTSAPHLFGVSNTVWGQAMPAERGTRSAFKCSSADAETPAQAALVSLWGALPRGQSYFLTYSPLQPGKEVELGGADWATTNLVGEAFVSNLLDVPTFITDGPRDLVVPTSALAPALLRLPSVLSAERTALNEIRVGQTDGARVIDVGVYPNAGHMVTMLAATEFTNDVKRWVGAHP